MAGAPLWPCRRDGGPQVSQRHPGPTRDWDGTGAIVVGQIRDTNRKESRARESKTNRKQHRKDEFITMNDEERRTRLAQILARGVLTVIGKNEIRRKQ